jgi:hypothetical protein
MLYGKKEVPYTDGVFQIRQYVGDRLVYTTVGKEVTGSRNAMGYWDKEYGEGYSKAASLLSQLQAKLRRDADNAILGFDPDPEPEVKKTLAQCVEDSRSNPSRSSALSVANSAGTCLPKSFSVGQTNSSHVSSGSEVDNVYNYRPRTVV